MEEEELRKLAELASKFAAEYGGSAAAAREDWFRAAVRDEVVSVLSDISDKASRSPICGTRA